MVLRLRVILGVGQARGVSWFGLGQVEELRNP